MRKNLYNYGFEYKKAENNCPRSKKSCNSTIAKMQNLWYHTSIKFLE